MIVKIPDYNSIIKWKMNDKDDWKSAEILDLINAYEKRSNEQIVWEQGYEAGRAQGKQEILKCDLIKRSDALKAVDNRHEELLHDAEYRRKHCQIDLLGIKKHILAMPPIDVEPQGEWINHRNDYGHNIADCSLCGKTMQWHDEDGDGVPRYCWYCGAPMKGVKTETKNPREGMDFKDYLAEKLKDPEFKKEWENVLKEEKNEKDSNTI